ncbi:proline dehydrogenase family protein, partial [Psychrobacter sp. SIMBA_152]
MYDTIMEQNPGMVVRIYAPVGPHKDLLPYLVRRLLENGANSSFVHKLLDADTPVNDLVEHPMKTASGYEKYANSKIPLPSEMYGDRTNSLGLN